MYCSTCASPVTPGLKFCNRCGMSLGKDREPKKESEVTAALVAGVILVALFGLGIMFGGGIALRQGGELTETAVYVFMLLCFAIVATVEVSLLRQLSRVLGTGGKTRHDQPAPLFQPSSASPNDLRWAPPRTLAEPVHSVTEHTTRTLQQSVREPSSQVVNRFTTQTAARSILPRPLHP
jgi:predicted nucleic acid-binding Zn ribbon protein